MKALVLDKKGSLDNLKVVTDFPIPRPSSTQVLLKVRATAINPVDWKMAEIGFFIKQYPIVLGCDVAGEVVEKGDQVQNVEIGDRVYAYNPLGVPNYGPFAEYCLADGFAVQKIPSSFSFEQAATLGVGSYTAFLGLFWRENLNLPLQNGNNRYVLVWGGSSAVGLSAVQFLAALGYHVIATCSARNMELVTRVGARQVFDHAQENVAQQILDYTGNKLRYVLDAVGDDRAYRLLNGNEQSYVAWTSKYSLPNDLPKNVKGSFVSLGSGYFVQEVITFLVQNCPPLIERLVGEGRFVTLNLELFHGIEHIKDALLKQKSGVSGTKVVVSIS